MPIALLLLALPAPALALPSDFVGYCAECVPPADLLAPTLAAAAALWLGRRRARA